MPTPEPSSVNGFGMLLECSDWSVTSPFLDLGWANTSWNTWGWGDVTEVPENEECWADKMSDVPYKHPHLINKETEATACLMVCGSARRTTWLESSEQGEISGRGSSWGIGAGRGWRSCSALWAIVRTWAFALSEIEGSEQRSEMIWCRFWKRTPVAALLFKCKILYCYL